jgi:protein TonB
MCIEDLTMFSNFATAVASSSAVTLALFYVMHLLIYLQPGAAIDPRIRHNLDWVAAPRVEDPPIVEEWTLDKDLIPPPPLPDTPRTDLSGDRTISVPSADPVPPAPETDGLGQFLSDGPLVSVVLVQPAYPAIAQTQGLEGFVIVQFDVGANGGVSNVRVVESSNRVFEKSALAAAKRCRFKPRVVDGVPIATAGVRQMFRFEME